MDRPAVDAKAKLDEAEHRVSVWAKTRASCDAAGTERLKAAEAADDRVARAAADVVRGSGTVEKLMDGIEAMHEELIRRRVALMYMQRKDLLAETDKERVQKCLRQYILPAGFGCVEYESWDGHLVHRAWKDAHESLRHDPDFPLPTT